MSRPISAGQPAPNFTLRDQDKTEQTLSDYHGRPIVLLFYPFDFSSVCSEEHACVRDAMATFNDLDAQVFGISVDSTYSHRAFADAKGLDYPLLADFHPKGEVSRQYGVYLEERGHSDRVVFVIDADGNVADVIEPGAPNVPDVNEIAAAVRRTV